MLNFAIIGVGRMGKRHTFNLARGFVGGVKLAAVCDISADALIWCEKYAAKANRYTDYKEMLEKEKLDGVIIATEHFAHTDIAKYTI
ncbi:MAG: gfo/Idh/MocA family oxidoreductase, partial [Clostridia bacterium]|nr:gfo/Idh/MocA family oxidoreductase [Clostridia bacterium]